MGIGKCMEDYLLLIIWFVTIHGPYSARCFRAYFARKSRAARLDAMKSKFFTTINGVFCRFCASRSVLLFAELRFFSRAVNSNYGFIFPGDGERMR